MVFHQPSLSHFITFVFVLQMPISPALFLAASKHPLVVIMAFDGFRYDYPSRGFTPTLQRLAHDGVSTDYLLNVFPTKTMTNFFSIATGMYAETHGVLGNTVFTENLECIKYSHKLFNYNEDIIPIWTLNELSGGGRYSGTMMWASSEYEFRGIKPSFHRAYNRSIPWHERINETLEWLKQDEKPLNLLLMYFEQPDSMGHNFGIYSHELNEQLKRVDEIIKYFMKGLQHLELDDKTDLIILSDHGMVNVDKTLIDLTSIINASHSLSCSNSPVLQLATKPEFRQQVYENLIALRGERTKFDVFKRKDIPERWHYKNNKRNTDFLLVARSPYGFQDEHGIGEHGYDNADKEMHAFFAAKGPHFKRNHHIGSLNNIDIYALVSYILELDTSKLLVKPNGTLSEIVTTLNSNLAADFKNPAKRHLLEYFIPLIQSHH